MSLTLGKSFDRNYNLRIPFLDGYYDIGLFFNKKSTFLLFKVDHDFPSIRQVKVNMFKNLQASKFCETFINLHNYKKFTLDIVNQFDSIKSEYFHELNSIINETISLSKVKVDDKVFFDNLTIYGFTLVSYLNEFLFIITERQNVIKKLGKKIVRTSGLQIATSNALKLLDEYHEDFKTCGKEGIKNNYINSNSVIKLSDIDKELKS